MTEATGPRYGDARRSWHPAFVEYMHSIVEHPNYAGMPCTVDDDGKIDWTIPSNRTRGSKNWDGNDRRREWWRAKADALGIPVEGHWLSRTAKTIHPTGRKPCQTCGRGMRLAYVYPTTATIARLNSLLPRGDELAWEDLLDVDEVVDHFFSLMGGEAPSVLGQVFVGAEVGDSPEDVKRLIAERFTMEESRLLSPGAMSNAPDRLDGFHTYNLCCRSSEDLGRSSENLRTYSDDRRAFENWTEGDWSAANLLMTQTGTGPCPACGAESDLTADHIGPLSLGFAHTPRFEVLCRRCNSAKSNRMSLSDVQALLALEAAGTAVASFQVLSLWEALKGEVQSDDDALLLSKLMRINQHHYLVALFEGWTVPDALLQFLHPEHAAFAVEPLGLNPTTLEYTKLERKPRAASYARSKAARMVRIAFDALRDYDSRGTRNIQVVADDLVSDHLAMYRAALAAAEATPSMLRPELLATLESDAPPETRSRLIADLLDGLDADTLGFRSVKDSLADLMAAYAVVLAQRYQRGESVSWED